MRKRIMDAYRVLRGELVATPRIQVPSTWIYSNANAATGANVTFKAYPKETP